MAEFDKVRCGGCGLLKPSMSTCDTPNCNMNPATAKNRAERDRINRRIADEQKRRGTSGGGKTNPKPKSKINQWIGIFVIIVIAVSIFGAD